MERIDTEERLKNSYTLGEQAEDKKSLETEEGRKLRKDTMKSQRGTARGGPATCRVLWRWTWRDQWQSWQHSNNFLENTDLEVERDNNNRPTHIQNVEDRTSITKQDSSPDAVR